jgi:hypothetical protein
LSSNKPCMIRRNVRRLDGDVWLAHLSISSHRLLKRTL